MHSRTRLSSFAGLSALVLMATAAVHAEKFPGGVFKGTDGTNDIALEFDTTGSLLVYVNNEAFSRGTWDSVEDTLSVGALEAPEGYGCPAGGRYLWNVAENQLRMTVVADDCQIRVQYFTGLAWTKR